jgi:hypothetical protein
MDGLTLPRRSRTHAPLYRSAAALTLYKFGYSLMRILLNTDDSNEDYRATELSHRR